MTECDLFQKHVGAFVDGELDMGATVDFERHLGRCAACRDRFEFEITFRDHLHEAEPVQAAPVALAARIEAALDSAEQSRSHSLSPLSWKYVLPMASAAAIVLLIGSVRGDNTQSEPARASLGSGLEDIVHLHSSRLPADIAVPSEPVSSTEPPVALHRFFEGRVGFPVRPAQFDGRAQLVGARVSNVRSRQAAALYYILEGGRRMTVVVTDAPMEGGEELQVDGRELRYRDVQGYPVPVRREAGLSYVFTGDMDRETLVHLAAQARVTY